jgi:Kef-type K+ transport system membrane component KefB
VKTLHTVTAVIELGAGLALLCFPSTTVALLVGGAPLDAPAALTVARVGGAALFALGVACWLARGDTQSRAARGLVAAMLLYDVATVAALAFAVISFGLHGVALWPAVVLHAVMTVWCVAWLHRSPLNVTTDSHSTR